ncbi:MAG: hypothetical protein RBS77_04150 [Candidatus Moranbacteria bacterium]|nr:hypothetical protein [Candidatus Moranbacteria bacterium]
MERFYAEAVKAFKELSLKDAKFLGISRKGEDWQFIFRVSSLSRETHWKNSAEVWRRISTETSHVDAGGMSLRNSILDAMASKVQRIGELNSAENEMMELGRILESSMIPEIAKKDIAERIALIASKLSVGEDKKPAHDYLLELANKIAC